ncbi:MAG: SDR family oxidoreductase [Roseiflexus sp.]|uniref:SDR family NAD(P)-dependent oxidoreductase n=1 Tax=Roseiflexus sp. TaxID=2562120 RepID=UPI0025E8291B|nr:SDR family oxidoreductase [Roseiflexus sp.]MCL6541740.1 SDR family oxidoreductase [Roseiflexus sp.]
MRLKEKIALITGGATGIGAACAYRFAREGAHVVIADINCEDGMRTAASIGGRFIFCDVGSADHCQRAVAETVAHYGRLDILVNAAARLDGHFNAAEMTEMEWRNHLAVTLDGVFYCSKYAVQEMLKTGGGSIVTIASVEGMIGAADHAAYVTGKSALFGLTRSMAIDFGARGVRVNTVSPGIIDSKRPDIERLKQDPAVMRFWRDMTVLGRMGHPDEVAAAVLFLASDEASYITGQNLAVDGGWTIGHPPVHRSFRE